MGRSGRLPMQGTFGPRAKVIEPDRKVTDLLDVLRLHLAMDVAVLGMWQDGLLVIQLCAGDPASFGLTAGLTLRRSRENFRPGRYPTVSRDVRHDPRVCDSPVLKTLGVGAYMASTLTD